MPVQRLDEGVVLGPHPAPGQVGQDPRVAFPGDHRLDHVLRGLVVSLLATRGQLDQGVFEQLLQPLPAPGPVPDQVGAGRV